MSEKRVWVSAQYPAVVTAILGADDEPGVNDREVGVQFREHGADDAILLTGEPAAVKSALRAALRTLQQREKDAG